MSVAGQHEPWNPHTVGIALAAYQPNPIWLAEQLASIAAQTYTAWVCIITLDSPLQEIRTAPELAPFLNDQRFTWVENSERLGLRSNFQKAMQLLLEQSVDLIAFCDQDDVWLPEKLAESVTAMRTHGPLSMVYCDAYLLVDGVTRPERLHEYTVKTRGDMSIAERIIRPQVSGFCEVFDASLAARHPTIPAESPHHDHWYSIVAAAYGGVHRIDKPLALYRQHAGNTVGITEVRAAQGWGTATQLTRYSGLRENARLRAGIARRVGIELPMRRSLALLYRHTAGWLLILLAVVGKRLFSDRALAAIAYRMCWGLLLRETSRREALQRARRRLPARIKLFRTGAALGLALLGGAVLVALRATSLSHEVVFMTVALILCAASALITWLRYVQHQMPITLVLLIGSGSMSGLLLQLFRVDLGFVLLVAALPIFANGCYRLRWALRS